MREFIRNFTRRLAADDGHGQAIANMNWFDESAGTIGVQGTDAAVGEPVAYEVPSQCGEADRVPVPPIELRGVV